MGKTPLQAKIEGGDLVIRVGLDTLAFAAECCEKLVDDPGVKDFPFVHVEDKRILALDVIAELTKEEEDGSSPLTELLDNAIISAVEQGSCAFSEDSFD